MSDKSVICPQCGCYYVVCKCDPKFVPPKGAREADGGLVLREGMRVKAFHPRMFGVTKYGTILKVWRNMHVTVDFGPGYGAHRIHNDHVVEEISESSIVPAIERAREAQQAHDQKHDVQLELPLTNAPTHDRVSEIDPTERGS